MGGHTRWLGLTSSSSKSRCGSSAAVVFGFRGGRWVLCRKFEGYVEHGNPAADGCCVTSSRGYVEHVGPAADVCCVASLRVMLNMAVLRWICAQSLCSAHD
jgi:hypothetical protein